MGAGLLMYGYVNIVVVIICDICILLTQEISPECCPKLYAESSSQSLRFILSLRLYSSFITSRPGSFPKQSPYCALEYMA